MGIKKVQLLSDVNKQETASECKAICLDQFPAAREKTTDTVVSDQVVSDGSNSVSPSVKV